MQEKQKDGGPMETTGEPETGEETWSDNQQSRSYYYDDSHGYEVFKDEADAPGYEVYDAADEQGEEEDSEAAP